VPDPAPRHRALPQSHRSRCPALALGSGQLAAPERGGPIDEEPADAASATPGSAINKHARARDRSPASVPAARPTLRVVPISGPHSREDCHEIGQGLTQAIIETGAQNDTLIVASTDMSHYVPAEVAKRLDTLALERVLALDPDGLYEVVTRQDISMCGFIPTCVMLVAARGLGASRAELVSYANSGEVSGFDQVVDTQAWSCAERPES
jgi:hypothetical protein